jgi:hypothetical protein
LVIAKFGPSLAGGLRPSVSQLGKAEAYEASTAWCGMLAYAESIFFSPVFLYFNLWSGQIEQQ